MTFSRRHPYFVPVALLLTVLAIMLMSIGYSSNLNFGRLSTSRIEKALYYPHRWDDNPVAYIPEAEVITSLDRYEQAWDDNPVAHIPEAVLIKSSVRYEHAWDDNPVAYIPEAEVTTTLDRYEHAWDDNPVAYIPESNFMTGTDK